MVRDNISRYSYPCQFSVGGTLVCDTEIEFVGCRRCCASTSPVSSAVHGPSTTLVVPVGSICVGSVSFISFVVATGDCSSVSVAIVVGSLTSRIIPHPIMYSLTYCTAGANITVAIVLFTASPIARRALSLSGGSSCNGMPWSAANPSSSISTTSSPNMIMVLLLVLIHGDNPFSPHTWCTPSVPRSIVPIR